MTDLIASLAESIVALNNSSPHLPRKDQIEALLRPALTGAIIPQSRDTFAPQIGMKVDSVTDNLIITGKTADIELGIAVTSHALVVKNPLANVADAYTTLVDGLWAALHCAHVWGPNRLDPTVTCCTLCGRGKP